LMKKMVKQSTCKAIARSSLWYLERNAKKFFMINL